MSRIRPQRSPVFAGEGSSAHPRLGRWGLGLLALLVLAAGCRQDMQDQPKFVPQRSTSFFADGRSVRPQVAHTVARGQLDEDQYFYTGLMGGREQNLLPFPVSMQVLERGQERFNIYCTPCHSRVGNGNGMIVQRGYKPAANFHDAMRMSEPLSHYFVVMTKGFGGMPDYSAQLTAADRWAVAAYIRALQLSQNAKLSDLPPGTQVKNLKDIAQGEGYPVSFAEPWALSPTANVIAEPPPVANQGNRGMAPAQDQTAPAAGATTSTVSPAGGTPRTPQGGK